VTVQTADDLILQIKGPFAGALPTPDDNLVMRAAKAIAATEKGHSRGAAITLEKNLPIASGIGGGSADAAAALKALRDLWSVPINDAALARLGLSLGADVPVCLSSRTSRMQGIGENIETLVPVPPVGVVIVNPGVAVSTAAVFTRRAGEFSAEADDCGPWSDAAAMVESLRQNRNDLTEAAIAIAPVIGDVLATLETDSACLLARLSGSGATCFGLFPDDDSAIRAVSDISAAHPDWWVRATRFKDF
jgi:4-diphosphocytidyl-2-C-methyl-D-erythritol kinase